MKLIKYIKYKIQQYIEYDPLAIPMILGIPLISGIMIAPITPIGLLIMPTGLIILTIIYRKTIYQTIKETIKDTIEEYKQWQPEKQNQ